MTDRIEDLKAQGYGELEASAMATVEWAHSGRAITRFKSGQVEYECGVCRIFICVMEWQPMGAYVERVQRHAIWCPIPAQGAAVLRAAQWYVLTECALCELSCDCGYEEEW